MYIPAELAELIFDVGRKSKDYSAVRSVNYHKYKLLDDSKCNKYFWANAPAEAKQDRYKVLGSVTA
jgi:hypothetical protein